MSLLDRLMAVGSIRKAIWSLWYPYLTRRLRGKDVLFLNYAYAPDAASGQQAMEPLALLPEDEPDRGCIQLYHQVATLSPVEGKDVLEVSCGHGGGASWITRNLRPASYTGLDLNLEGIAYCQRRHPLPSLTFRQGDAQRLPFPDGSFDVALNVEASHCYPDFQGFLREVARVLRPGGHFHYTDFRFADLIPSWEADIAAVADRLKVVQNRDIGRNVLNGMEMNAERNLALVRDHLPRFLQRFGRDFAGVPGSIVHKALQDGSMSYRMWCFEKV